GDPAHAHAHAGLPQSCVRRGRPPAGLVSPPRADRRRDPRRRSRSRGPRCLRPPEPGRGPARNQGPDHEPAREHAGLGLPLRKTRTAGQRERRHESMTTTRLSRTDRMIATKDGPIGWIVFNNPARRNAVSTDMWEALAEIVADYARDDAIRVIVLRGAGGKAFVSGADISEFEEK